MSKHDSPAALEPNAALLALLQQSRMQNGALRDDDELIDEFLATWVVVKPEDIMAERASQAMWQQDAKTALAVLVTALGNIGNNYPALTLGPRVLAEAERLIREKGMDPDEVLERFLP